MGHHWILETLSDLQSYAKRNGLLNLHVALDQVTVVASNEIAEKSVIIQFPSFGIACNSVRSRTPRGK